MTRLHMRTLAIESGLTRSASMPAAIQSLRVVGSAHAVTPTITTELGVVSSSLSCAREAAEAATAATAAATVAAAEAAPDEAAVEAELDAPPSPVSPSPEAPS